MATMCHERPGGTGNWEQQSIWPCLWKKNLLITTLQNEGENGALSDNALLYSGTRTTC